MRKLALISKVPGVPGCGRTSRLSMVNAAGSCHGGKLQCRVAHTLEIMGRQRALAARLSRCASSSCSTSRTDKPATATRLRQPMRDAALARARGRVKLGASVRRRSGCGGTPTAGGSDAAVGSKSVRRRIGCGGTGGAAGAPSAIVLATGRLSTGLPSAGLLSAAMLSLGLLSTGARSMGTATGVLAAALSIDAAGAGWLGSVAVAADVRRLRLAGADGACADASVPASALVAAMTSSI